MFTTAHTANVSVTSTLFRPRPGTDRPPEPMIFLKYVNNNLADICDESGLQGISYTEGPLCPHCKEIVLPLLWYGMKGRGEDPYLVHHPKLTGRPRPGETGGGPRDRDEPMIRCDTCLRDSNVYKLLKRKVCTSIIISHCYATSYPPCIPITIAQSTDRMQQTV